MYLLDTAARYIILPPPKISVGCGPDTDNHNLQVG